MPHRFSTKNMAKKLFFSNIMRALQTMRHKKMILLSILPFLSAFCVWWIFIISGFENFTWFLNQFPSFWREYSMQPGFFPQISLFILVGFAGISMLLYGVIVVGVCMLFVGFLISPLITNFIATTFYSHITINPSPLLKSLQYSSILFTKTFARFAFFSLCCFLLTLIGLGFVGLVLHIFVYFRFFSQNINHEVALNIMSKEEYELFLRSSKVPLFFFNAIVFILLYIPIVNFFVLPLQITILSHFMLSWYEQYFINTNDEHIEEAEVIEYK